MEHIGNYLDKYRHMIAEHDAQVALSAAVDSLQTALIDQGKAIEDCKKACQEALEGLEAMKKQYAHN
jgi:hypothetical protein